MTRPMSPRLREALLEIVENQLSEGTPLETRETLAHLTQQGFSREEAVNLIGQVVLVEIYDVLRSGRGYNEARYVKALKALPELPRA